MSARTHHALTRESLPGKDNEKAPSIEQLSSLDG
jgi:hypothetical protein